MFQKKKWVIGGLILPLAIGLAACGGKKGAASEAVQSGSGSSDELVPEYSQGAHSNIGTIGFALGFVLMMVLDVVLG